LPPDFAQTAAQAATKAALADLPAAQVPEVRAEACIMFKAMTNVAVQRAPKAIRWNKRLGR